MKKLLAISALAATLAAGSPRNHFVVEFVAINPVIGELTFASLEQAVMETAFLTETIGIEEGMLDYDIQLAIRDTHYFVVHSGTLIPIYPYN